MGKYSKVVQQLVGAAHDRGLFSDSQIFALGDGARGLLVIVSLGVSSQD